MSVLPPAMEPSSELVGACPGLYSAVRPIIGRKFSHHSESIDDSGFTTTTQG
ncbi:hypothetical protein [Zymobacter sp. IVIA_5232.4 C2]|uniref:hypothetical protein n=1 Tax=Zymobacter sp. IVIA_5232.4 C2 TaxID=3394855 RepID=UPI0039C3770A